MSEKFYKNDEYFLSYLESPSEMAQRLDQIIAPGNSNIGRSETAICTRHPWRCLILYGDHRKEMLPIAHDMGKLEAYWRSRPDLHGHTTDEIDEI